MLQDFFKALSLIFFAEMGDKTQILAMAFATRFMVKDIVLGVALGAGLNHMIAIILGTILSKFISIDFLQIAAGIVFVTFALLSLSCDGDDEDEENKKQLSPILTVAFAFFMGELGDKTQISALTLSLDSNFPLFILLGTTSGMVLTSLLGIFVGNKIGEKIPEFQLKIVAFIIFLIFGIQKISSSIYFTKFGLMAETLILGIISILSIYRFYQFYQLDEGCNNAIKKAAKKIYHKVKF